MEVLDGKNGIADTTLRISIRIVRSQIECTETADRAFSSDKESFAQRYIFSSACPPDRLDKAGFPTVLHDAMGPKLLIKSVDIAVFQESKITAEACVFGF